MIAASRPCRAGIRTNPRGRPVDGLPFPLILCSHNDEGDDPTTLPVMTLKEATWSTVFALP